MATTSVQHEIGRWLREHWMPKQFGQPFTRRPVRLQTGGTFNFAAVSEDESIVGTISTSSALTAAGKEGTAKFHKLRSDMLYLTMAPCPRRVMILTDSAMHQRCLHERKTGRVPACIEFLHAEIPAEYASKLTIAQAEAAKEVTPDRIAPAPADSEDDSFEREETERHA